jgi:parvulin-like peptidyl-prolyl isomerase
MNGKDFAKAASSASDDEFTKNVGGELGYVFRSNTELPPQIVERAFSLAAGEISPELAQTLFGYHIVKTLEYRDTDEAKIAHILIRFKDIGQFVDEREAQIDTNTYITLPER